MSHCLVAERAINNIHHGPMYMEMDKTRDGDEKKDSSLLRKSTYVTWLSLVAAPTDEPSYRISDLDWDLLDTSGEPARSI